MNNFWKRAFRSAVPLFLGLTMTVISFFIIFRFDGIMNGFNRITVILKPFIYGGVLAYLLKTPYNWIEKKLDGLFKGKKPGLVKALSVILVILLAFLVIIILFSLIIPALAESIVSIIKEVPGALSEAEKVISKYKSENNVLANYITWGIEAVKTNGIDWLKEKLLPELGSLMGNFANVFGSFLGFLYNLLIGVIICIYLLLGKSNFARQGKMLIYSIFKKDFAEKVLAEFRYIDKIFVGFFGGKILDSTIVGLICYVFCLIMQLAFGMKNAVLIAVIVGVTNIIPFFGPYIGLIPSALIILMDSPVLCIAFIIFIAILQQVDGNILGPMLLSGSVGLTGFWVLFSITSFGGLFGITGVLVGVPVFAVIYDLIRRWVHMMLKKHGVSEYLPSPEEDGTVPEGEQVIK